MFEIKSSSSNGNYSLLGAPAQYIYNVSSEPYEIAYNNEYLNF